MEVKSVRKNEQFQQINLGVTTADAENVELLFTGGSLSVRYVDWQEKPREAIFKETIAFSWQEQDSTGMPRNDVTYEVSNSEWFARQVSDQPNAARFHQYRLCFNACGVLDVICAEIET